ncbi:MAG: galactose oxidase [Gammaproteobacteria bacterium]|nr:galactose oxidase [Gammaproteobacteria bacterium]
MSNNAVVSVAAGGAEFIISFAGLGERRGYADTLAVTYVFDSRTRRWSEADPVPGGVGRLASAAASAGDLAFVFGGYTVSADGSETSTPWVHAFDPLTGNFEERQAMPVPVDDAVAVSYSDRFIFLVSGWHDDGNVNLVQRYDTRTDSWSQATPTPGRGVFGHAGGIVDDTIFYCDGVAIEPGINKRRTFVANEQCFAGTIDKTDSRRIDWRIMPPHPGAVRYRMAAAGIDDLNAVVFVGGSDNPYNFDGIGYNGEPSRPASRILRYDVEHASWTMLSSGAAASMDHRALAYFEGEWLTVGGMLDDQRVTAGVVAYDFR